MGNDARAGGRRPVLGWKPKVFDPSVASVRYRCLLPLRALQARAFPVTLYQDSDRDRYAGVIFSKLYDADDQALARRLKAQGAKVILDLCDNHFYNPYGLPAYCKARTDLLGMLELADVVVCSTPALADIVAREAGLPRRPAVVGDPVDVVRLDDRQLAKRRMAGSPAEIAPDGVPRLLWFGIHGAPNAPCGMLDLINLTDVLQAAGREHPFEVVVVSNDRAKYERHIGVLPWRSRYAEWTPASLPGLLAEAAAVLVPITPNPFTLCKSNNRVATALAAGVPVVADEIPSYREFADYCYLNDWAGGLRAVFTAYGEAAARAGAGRAYVARCWSSEAVAHQWEKLLAPLVEWSPSPVGSPEPP